jgi:hypothetical protein
MSLHGERNEWSRCKGECDLAAAAAAMQARQKPRLGDFSHVKESPSGKISVEHPSTMTWAFTWAGFHVWARQGGSGRAEMCSHRWITNGRHQA